MRLFWVAVGSALLAGLLLTAPGCSRTPQAAALPVATTPTGATAPAAAAPTPPEVPGLQADLEYGVAGGVSLKLDAAVPSGEGPFPAAIMIHGGGWVKGDKGQCRFAMPTYLKDGIACFAINYRLAPQAIYPAQVDDCLTAVRWVRAHAKEYKIDPDRLAVIGGSAGGHLALMVGTAKPTDQDLDAQGKRLKSLVVAMVSLSGPTDFTTYDNALAKQILPQFLGGTREGKPEVYKEASPLFHVTADSPPTLIAHGTKDPYVPMSQSTDMADKLKAAGVSVQMMPIEGMGHEVSGMFKWQPVMKFMVEHLHPTLAPSL